MKKLGLARLKSLGKKLLEVADEADERGGRFRDELKERLSSSERLARLRKLKPSALGPVPSQGQTNRAEPLPVSEPVKFSFGDSRKAAQVFGARSCSWSGRASRLLESEKISPNYVDLDHPASGPLREELRVETGQLTVPYIYIRGCFIGGFNALDEIHRLGQLQYLILNDEDRRQHPNHGKISITDRATNVDSFSRPPDG